MYQIRSFNKHNSVKAPDATAGLTGSVHQFWLQRLTRKSYTEITHSLETLLKYVNVPTFKIN